MFGLRKEKKEEKVAASAPVKAAADPKSQRGAVATAVLKRPMVSEKALGLEASGRYVFEVSAAATKPEIKKEVERLYGVKVEKVNTAVAKPRTVLFKGRAGRQSGFKKAVVRLAAGEKIEVLPK